MPKKYGSYYNKTNICDRCKINRLIPGNAFKEYKNGNWTGKWICLECYNKEYLKNRYDEMKYVRGCRSGNVNPNSTNAKGGMFEQLTCEWRCVKNLNKENDNYRSPIDHSRDTELGIIQTKGALYNAVYRWWIFNTCAEHNKEFDYLIAYCTDKDMNSIDRVYIFPRLETMIRTKITIYEDSSRLNWYEKYRVKDEEVIKKINEIWKRITKQQKR